MQNTVRDAGATGIAGSTIPCGRLPVSILASIARHAAPMANRYPRFRDAQANPGPFGQRRPAPRRRSSFVATVASGCIAVFAVTWIITPDLQRVWALSHRSPEEIAAAERSVTYSGCNAARAAGAAPIYRGTPGYRPEMDGDSDGIACEPIPY